MPNLRIDRIEGIGRAYAQTLDAAGIIYSDDLLEAGRTRAGRAKLAELTGIRAETLLRWVHRVDLCRIAGIGPEYADLLQTAGVETLDALRHQDAQALAARCAEVNANRKLTRRLPSARVIGGWIEKAAKLPPCVER